MRPKSLVLLLLALGCGLVASLGISQVMSNKQPAADGDSEKIFVAKQDIKYNEPITMANVMIEDWPKSKIPPNGALTKVEEIENHRANMTILSGEPILTAKLWGPGEGKGPLDGIPKGMRVATVQVNGTSANGFLIRPGDYVDVLVFINQKTSNIGSEIASRIILQHIQVWAVDQAVRHPGEKDDLQATSAKTVSLLVTPLQSQKILLAGEIGKVQLISRDRGDDNEESTRPMTISELFGNAPKDPAPEGEPVHEAPPVVETKPATNVLDLLGHKDAGTTAPAVSPTLEPKTEQFTMELLTGSEMKKVEFTVTQGTTTSSSLQPTEAAPQVITPAGDSDSHDTKKTSQADES